jgi:hypothetical protein
MCMVLEWPCLFCFLVLDHHDGLTSTTLPAVEYLGYETSMSVGVA